MGAAGTGAGPSPTTPGVVRDEAGGRVSGLPARGRLPRTVAALGGAATFLLLTAALILVSATPARAHAGGGAQPSNYRVAVTSVPAPVNVQVGVGGQWVRVRLAATASGPVEVLGYRGEPFLRISADGVRLNQRSTVAADNPRLAASERPGAGSGPAAGPRWIAAGTGGGIAWFDRRTSTGTGTWRLPLRIGGEPAVIAGTRAHVDPPRTWLWVTGLVLVTAAVAALGWRTEWHRPAAAALIAAALTGAAHLAGSALAPAPGPATSAWLSALFIAALCWPIAALATVLVLRGREHAPFAVAVAGTVLAVASGPGDLHVLWHSQLAFAWPAGTERVLVVVTVGTGLGLAIAGVQHLRRTGGRAALLAQKLRDHLDRLADIGFLVGDDVRVQEALADPDDRVRQGGAVEDGTEAVPLLGGEQPFQRVDDPLLDDPVFGGQDPQRRLGLLLQQPAQAGLRADEHEELLDDPSHPRRAGEPRRLVQRADDGVPGEEPHDLAEDLVAAARLAVEGRPADTQLDRE